MGFLEASAEEAIHGWVPLPVVSTHSWTRRALLIGQDAYKKIDKLRAAGKDVDRVAEQLKKMGFDDVRVAKNLSSAGISRKIEAFCQGVQDNHISMVYFAGHCAAQGDTNYLLGVDAAENKDGVDLQEGLLAKLAGCGKQQIITVFIDGNRAKRGFSISGNMQQPGQNSYMVPPEVPRADHIHVVLGAEPGKCHTHPAFKGQPTETFFTDVLLEELDSSRNFVEMVGSVAEIAADATKGTLRPVCYHTGNLAFGLADTNVSSPQAITERSFHNQLASSVLSEAVGRALAADLTPRMVGTPRAARWEFEATAEEKFLDFSGRMLEDSGAVALATLVKPCCCSTGRWDFNPNVYGLNLSANDISETGAAALASAISPRRNPGLLWTFNPHISSLQLHENRISDEGCAAIMQALAPKQSRDGTWVFNSSMRHVRLGSSICNNKMGGKTAAAVLAVLAVRENPDGTPAFNNSLTEMELDGNSFSEEESAKIQEALNMLNSTRATKAAITALRAVGMNSKISTLIKPKGAGGAAAADKTQGHVKTALNNLVKGRNRPPLKMSW